MIRFAPVDLDRLPAPQVIEPLDFEALFGRLRDALAEAAPELAPVLALESEPLVKALQVWAYEALRTRARINDAARGCLLATAAGSDLDNLAALLGVTRAETPPEAEGDLPGREADARLRERARLALQAYSSAGPAGAYRYWALTADSRVQEALVTSPAPGQVRVTVLPQAPLPAPADLLAAVTAAVTAPDVRVLTDSVTVQAATGVSFAVAAELRLAPLADPALVPAAAEAALAGWLAARRGLGRPVHRSALIAALHVAGVEAVDLTLPAADVLPGPAEVAEVGAITLTLAPPEPAE